MVVTTSAAPVPLSILHLIAPAQFGGAESVVRGLAAGQHARGHCVTVAASLSPDDQVPPFLTDLANLGVAVEVMRVPPRGYAQEVRLVRALCSRLRPDVAHTHGYRSDLVAGHAARRAGIPLVTTVHGFTTGSWRNQLNQALERLAFRRFDAVVAVSALIAERVLRWGVRPERVRVIANAYVPVSSIRTREEARTALGITDSSFRFGWVGRVDRDKALDVLVEALAQLQDLQWQLSVIGDGPDVPKLRQRAGSLGFESRITWHGVVPGAGGLMTAFDTYVLSSRTEGTPIVLLEAMAAGTPVVATKVGGVPDVVGAVEALLIAPGKPAALAEALRSTLGDPDGARGRAGAASERLRAFDARLWLDRYDEVYRAAVARGRRRPVEASI